jgi:hypothetical protein
LPDLQLGPDDYKVRTKRGNWVRRDAAYMIPIAAVMCGGIIGYVWWHRDEMSLAVLFGFAIVMAVAFGMILGAWLKRFD